MVSCTSLLGTSLGSGSMREVGGDWGADRLAGEGFLRFGLLVIASVRT